MHILDLDAVEEPQPVEVQDKAFELLENVNATSSRLSAQLEQLARLRAEVTVLRELAARGAAPPPTAAIPSALPPPIAFEELVDVPLPVSKEAAADSAPVAVSFKAGWIHCAHRAVPYAALLILGLALQFQAQPPAAANPPSATPVRIPSADASSALDEEANRAIYLVQDWRIPGDEKPLSERLDSVVQLPGTASAWSAERVGDGIYHVAYRRLDDSPPCEFDVDVESGRVDPAPLTAELLSPKLTASR